MYLDNFCIRTAQGFFPVIPPNHTESLMKILKLLLQNKNKRKATKNKQQNNTPEMNHKKQQKSTKQKTIQLIVYSYKLLLQPLGIWLLMLLLNQIPESMCEEENENSRSNPY